MRLYVGSLHFNITEDMLRGIFGPFGRVSNTHTQTHMWWEGGPSDCHFLSVLLQIDNIQLMMDSETGRSKGYGFITVSD